ncbi:MAG: hypothetical protein REI45_01935, partial [Propionicimonas sp.]|nr:hypothetical protein [Propionicimonas sp.]
SETVPAAAGQWLQTATPPLEGRRDAVPAWVDGRYLIVGGLTDAPCDPGATCADGTALADGALYDPADNTWTTISDAPTGLAQTGGASNPYPQAAVVGDTVYIQALGDTLLAYHPDSDTWTTLPTAPGYRTSTLAGSFDNRLILFPWGQCTGPDEPCRSAAASDYITLDPATGSLTDQSFDLAIPNSVNGATVVGGRLVISWLVDENTLGTALVDLATHKVTALPDISTGQRPAPVAVGGYAAWPRDPDTAWFLDPATRAWSSVAMPATPGPLTGDTGVWPIVIGETIALDGHPYNPATQILWDDLAALPISDRAPTLVGGADTALACFGYDPGRAAYNHTCRLLVFNPPPGVPSIAPEPDVNSTHVATEPAPIETFDAPSVAPSPGGQSTP